MISRVSRPTRLLVWLANILTVFCLTASLSSADEGQPRWVTNEAEWVGEVAQCFGFSVSETARRWRRLQAAAESSVVTGPDLRRLFTTLAFLTQHTQSTPADAATSLQLFETGFIQGHLTTGDVRTLNVALPGARAFMAQGLGWTPEKLESIANIGVFFTSVAATALRLQVEKLVTTQGQGSAPCGFSALPPAPPHQEAPPEQKKGRPDATKRKMHTTTGTVYYSSNGSHGGMILLKTDSGLLHLSWDDESQLKLSDSVRVWNNGAVWQVAYYKKDNGSGYFYLTIDKATFTGEVNSSIDVASTLIKKYYELLARRMYTEAYELFNEKQKAQTTIKNLWQNNPTFTAPGDVDFCSQPKCVDIKIVSHDKAKVIIQVDTSFLKKHDLRNCLKNIDTCYYQHIVINRGGSWYTQN